MDIKKLIAAACAAALCGGVLAADEAKPVPTETANSSPAVQEQEEKDDSPLDGLVAVEAGIAFDSRYMTYGVMDGKDPIVKPRAQITFFDWVYFGIESIFDVTKGNGKRGGYGNRAGRYTTIDSIQSPALRMTLIFAKMLAHSRLTSTTSMNTSTGIAAMARIAWAIRSTSTLSFRLAIFGLSRRCGSSAILWLMTART